MTAASPSRTQKVTLAFTLAAVVALGVVNWRIFNWAPDISPAQIADNGQQPAAAAQKRQAPLPKPPVAPQSGYPNILARPLFDPTRRPPPPDVPKVAAPPPKAAPPPFPVDQFKLVGILRTSSTPARALLRTNQSELGTWVDEGGTFAGWHLDRIGEDRVDLSANGSAGSLKLQVRPMAALSTGATQAPKP